MDDKTKRELHRLIAGGRLSRPELEVLRESVLDEIERTEGRGEGEGNGERKEPGRGRERGRVIRIASWASTVIAAAAVALLMVRAPKEPGREVHEEESGDVAPRPVIEVSCAGGTLEACPATSSLVFSVSKSPKATVLSAWAEPQGKDGEREFYFSTEDGWMEIPGGSEEGPLLRLTRVQGRGRYRVHAFVTERALGREEMQRGGGGGGVLAKVRVELVIVE